MRQRDDRRLKSFRPGSPGPTCDDWLTFVRPHLSEALVGPKAFERLREIARQLPGDGLAALEIRLASDVEAVDLSLKVSHLHGLDDSSFSPRTRRLLRRWAAGELPSVASVWLELDAERSRADLPEPVLCAEVARGADPARALDEIFQNLDESRRTWALRCIAVIPPPARLLYVFDLSARGTQTLRLEILGLPPQNAPAFLAGIAPHLTPAVAKAAPLLIDTERPHLSFDIGPEGIGARAGLEGSFVKWPHREPRWRELFDRLVDHGLCAPGKRDAVFEWPGQETFWSAPGHWPTEAAGTRGVCVRALSHVKVVARPDHTPEAKAYLLFGWIGHAATLTPGPSPKGEG